MKNKTYRVAISYTEGVVLCVQAENKDLAASLAYGIVDEYGYVSIKGSRMSISDVVIRELMVAEVQQVGGKQL